MKNPFAFDFKVRFHLGKGKNFMHWRIENMDNNQVKFFDPKEYSFIFYNVFLRNQKGAANKIHSGANKTVCAWIECEHVQHYHKAKDKPAYGERIVYNPKYAPCWVVQLLDSNDNLIGHEICDKQSYPKLLSKGNQVFMVEESVNSLFTSNELQAIKRSQREDCQLEQVEYKKYI